MSQGTRAMTDAALSQFVTQEVAEREGFEPPVVLPTHAFQACALNHSAISPLKEAIMWATIFGGASFLAVSSRVLSGRIPF